eukprot:1948673-Alexandrium_andersonii.AAC.1
MLEGSNAMCQNHPLACPKRRPWISFGSSQDETRPSMVAFTPHNPSRLMWACPTRLGSDAARAKIPRAQKRRKRARGASKPGRKARARRQSSRP